MKDGPRDFRQYQDMLDVPHHVSPSRPRLPIPARAAQFAPFAALTGHEAAIKERARLTRQRPQLDEEEKGRINRILLELKEKPGFIRLTYFCPDRRKEGGSLVQVSGKVRRLDQDGKRLVMEDGARIPFEDIVEVEMD